MAKKGINTDFTCPSCASKEFIVGKSYAVPGGELNYTLRCAHCISSKGETTYVKNVSQAVMDTLVSQNRILAEPQIVNASSQRNLGEINQPMQAQQSSQANYGTSAIPPAFASSAVPPRDSAQSQNINTQLDLGYIAPPPPEFGRQMIPDEPAPFEEPQPVREEQTPPPAFIPYGNKCAACQRNLSVKVNGTRFVSRINNDRVTYSDELTGTVVLTQHVSFCPFCGRKLGN